MAAILSQASQQSLPPPDQVQAYFSQLPQPEQMLVRAIMAQQRQGLEGLPAATSPTQSSSRSVGSSSLITTQLNLTGHSQQRCVAEGAPQQQINQQLGLSMQRCPAASPGRPQRPPPGATLPASPARIPPPMQPPQQQLPVGACMAAAVQPVGPCAAVQQASAGPSRPGEGPPRVLDLHPS